MHYPDGQLAQIGDIVRLWNGNEGVVVCSIDTGEYSTEYPEIEWSYLQKGVLIRSSETGLIHYPEPEATFELLSRGTPTDD